NTAPDQLRADTSRRSAHSAGVGTTVDSDQGRHAGSALRKKTITAVTGLVGGGRVRADNRPAKSANKRGTGKHETGSAAIRSDITARPVITVINIVPAQGSPTGRTVGTSGGTCDDDHLCLRLTCQCDPSQ